MTKLRVATALLILMPMAVSAHDHAEMSAEEKAMMEAYMKAATPGPQHAAMASKAGAYALEIKNFAPDGTTTMESGKATRRMNLDGRVMVEEVQASMMGQSFTGYGMTGYDNVSGRYWSTWNDSMSTGIMVSDGSCDDKGKCAFSGSWNDPLTKAPVSARTESEWMDDATEIFRMYGPGPDGKEMQMMEITYRRQ